MLTAFEGRAFVLGWACGGRASFGPAALVLTTRSSRPVVRAAGSITAVVCAGGECVVDKLPMTPSRLVPQALAGRVASGAVSAIALARRNDRSIWLPAAMGGAGALAGSFAGAAWRRWAVQRVPDWQAAVVEDVATAGVVWRATRPITP